MIEPTPTEALAARVRASFAPPSELRVSEFSDQTVIVTSGPLAGTHWQTDFAPYQRGILDVFHEPGIEIAVVMGSSQWGKTSIAVNLCAYHIKHDPCSILVVEPTEDPMARDFAKNRLDPIIDASPELSDAVRRKRNKRSGGTVLQKTFRGGSLSIAGANSASSLAARPVRVLICDEVDRYPAELPGEGATLAIAFKRTTTFRRRRRILLLSSPTLAGSPIHEWWSSGDQRRYYVPCPSCKKGFAYEWQLVKWERDPDRPSTARIHCPSCGHGLDDAERVAMLKFGTWIADKPDRDDASIVSFHLWEAYSPFSSLSEIVTNFLRARRKQKEGDRAEMHTWINTTLGEPVEPDEGEGAEPHALLARREEYAAPVPTEAVVLTAGIDIQDDRIEGLVIGWGIGEESWLVDRFYFAGDTEGPEPWRELEQALENEYRHSSGPTLPIACACIDSAGHRTTIVYDFVGRHPRTFAIIGRDGERPIVSSPTPRSWGRNGRQVPLYTIGVDSAKALWQSRLILTEHGPGFAHLPIAPWADEELCQQLTSERLIKRFKKGVPRMEWIKRRPRNEGLDCAVYAVAALRLLHPDLKLLADRLANPNARTPPPPRKPAGFLGPSRRGWLRR